MIKLLRYDFILDYFIILSCKLEMNENVKNETHNSLNTKTIIALVFAQFMCFSII